MGKGGKNARKGGKKREKGAEQGGRARIFSRRIPCGGNGAGKGPGMREVAGMAPTRWGQREVAAAAAAAADPVPVVPGGIPLE